MAWIRIGEAAKMMGMSRLGATKRLRRLETATGQRILRQTGSRSPIEVNVEALRSVTEGTADHMDRDLENMRSQLAFIGSRVDAIRAVSKRHRTDIRALVEAQETRIRLLERALAAATSRQGNSAQVDLRAE
jgi:hypothetical protein